MFSALVTGPGCFINVPVTVLSESLFCLKYIRFIVAEQNSFYQTMNEELWIIETMFS